ncbi:MAG: hypothetical protein C0392_03295 [Syntrophus sp. (in: bacteria)]|nr:hypothetical protein [Syntrophus sp. (in: bacteria)]
MSNVYSVGEEKTIQCNIRDITAHKAAAKALTQEAERAKDVLESISDAFMSMDNNFVATYFNCAAERMLKRQSHEVVGQYLFDAFPEARGSVFEEKYLQAVKEKTSMSFVTYFNVEPYCDWYEVQVYSWEEGISVYFQVITERKQIEDAQLFLLQSNWASEDFFESLARYLAETLSMDFVCIDSLEGDCLSARTVAVYFDGKFEDNISYALKDTPCGDVAGKTICSFPRDVRHLFPQDVVLQEMVAEGYMGTTLWSSKGQPIGLIALISRKPLSNPHLVELILKLVGVRAAGELERRDVEEQVKSSLEEKKILLKEVHHRIKNNMSVVVSLLSLHAEKMNDPSAIAALEDAENRVQSMMVLYDKLYRSADFREISSKEYLTSLIDEIVSNFSNRWIVTIEKQIDDFILDAKTLSPMGMILNELLTNTMKYAFTGRDNGLIQVSFSLKDNHAILIIEDNGIGIPESVDIATSTGFGLQLVGMLTEQLGGTIRIERQNGSAFILEFNV